MNAASRWRTRDPIDLIQRDLVAGAIVKLCRARAFVRRHGLSVFECAAGLEIRGDASRAEHVAAELALEAGFGRPSADHLIGVDAVHRAFRQHPGSLFSFRKAMAVIPPASRPCAGQ